MGKASRRGVKATRHPSENGDDEDHMEVMEFKSESALRSYMDDEEEHEIQEAQTQSELPGLSRGEEREMRQHYRLWSKTAGGRSYVRLIGSVYVTVYRSALGGWKFMWNDNERTHFSEGSYPSAEECKREAFSFIMNRNRPAPQLQPSQELVGGPEQVENVP
jgi:hypothetical protein